MASLTPVDTESERELASLILVSPLRLPTFCPKAALASLALLIRKVGSCAGRYGAVRSRLRRGKVFEAARRPGVGVDAPVCKPFAVRGSQV